MAQTVLQHESAGLVNGSFAAPPGLETGATPSSLAEDAARTTPEEHTSLENQCEVSVVEGILDDVRRTVLADVDAKVSDKMKDLWSRGKDLLNQIEQENNQKTAEFVDQLTRCREKQESLAAEQAQLRYVMGSVVQQLAMLGAIMAPGQQATISAKVPSFENSLLSAPPTPSPAPGLSLGSVKAANIPGSAASTSPSGETPSAAASATSGVQDSPPEVLTLAFSTGVLGAPPLPVLPDFPFPPTGSACHTPVPSIATPLSLAEALSSDLPTTTTPLSLSSSLTPSVAETAPSMTTKMFSFTLRKADNTELGLSVCCDDKVLRVEGVRADGAIEAWNRQCVGNQAAEKAVMPGDRIISVNGVIYNPVKMLEECRDRQLLKFTIVRGDGQLPGTPGVTKTTTLRADASEFVPAGLASESKTQKDDVPESKTEADSVET
jgi:hypothetical protein